MLDALVEALKGSLSLVLPDIVLLATVAVVFFGAPFLTDERGRSEAGLRLRWSWLALAAVGFSGWLWYQSTPVEVGDGPFRLDGLAWFVRGLSLATLVVLLLVNWNQVPDGASAESIGSLLAIGAGVNLIAASNDLVYLFLALELVSIPTYLFLFLPRRDAAAQEATTKYFLLSAFSSGIVLFGMSYVFGVVGSTNLQVIGQALAAGQNGPLPMLLPVAAILLIAGLGFRITAVPFHFYAPDVFQGAGTSGAAMLSFVPKIAGFVALIRLLIPSGWMGPDAQTLANLTGPTVWWLAVITMFVGNLLAILQTDVRRLLAFSSIAHAGYMLVGFQIGRETHAGIDGIDALLFYLTVYGAMSLGAFAALIATSDESKRYETIDDLGGLSRTRPAVALLMTLFLFSMMGLPPTAGFLAKLNLFFAAWSQGTESGRWLAIFLAVNAAIAAWYYLRIIAAMYLREPAHAENRHQEPAASVAMACCALVVLGLFFAPDWLWRAISVVS